MNINNMDRTHKIILIALAVLAVGYVLVSGMSEYSESTLASEDSVMMGVGGEALMYSDAEMPMMDLARVTTSQYYEPPF